MDNAKKHIKKMHRWIDTKLGAGKGSELLAGFENITRNESPKDTAKWAAPLSKRLEFNIFILLAIVFIGNIFANDTISFTLEITGINVNQGQIYVKIYSNDRDYRNDIPHAVYVLESASQDIVYSFDILEGEYLIALFQDTNNNGRLDTNLLGFPREPVGLSNYSGGIPGGFNRQKIPVNNNSNRLTINIWRV